MIGRPFRVDWHPEDTPEALRAAYRAQQDTMLRTRLHGLWLVRSGRQMGEVASVVGVHYRTLQRWVSWYRKGGVDEVLSHRMKGSGSATISERGPGAGAEPRRLGVDGSGQAVRSGSG